MGNDYEVKIYTIETTEGIEYVAEIPELKGCIGSGNSYEEALEELLENKTVYLETLKDLGKEIPLPKQKKKKFSGKLSLRLSTRLHKKIADVADELGISINQYIVETLAESVGANIKVLNLSQEKLKQKEQFVLKSRSFDSYEKYGFIYKKEMDGVN